jgi:hypothetical protein
MTTFPINAGQSAYAGTLSSDVAGKTRSSDVVGLNHDMDSLALHMRHCAMARGKWPRVQRALYASHALMSPRIVTAASVGVLMAIAAFSVAVICGWIIV